MIDYVAIPTYQRADLICEMTLPMLDRLGHPRERTTAWVANEQERATYRQALDASGWQAVDVRVSGKGIARSRNIIHASYPVGKRLLVVEDDIEDMRISDGKKLHSITPEQWVTAVEFAFDMCIRHRARLWGVYASANPFYMTPTITTKLCYIPGGLYGCFNWGDDPARQRTGLDAGDPKDDFEESILCYLADGALVRLNWVTFKTRCWRPQGGLATTRTVEGVRDRCIELARMYPGLCKVTTAKKSTPWDVRLRDTRKGKDGNASKPDERSRASAGV